MQQPQTTAKPKVTSKARVLASLENAKKLVEQRKKALEAIEARERTKANRTPASVINKQKYLLGAYAMEKRPQVMKSAEFQEWLKRPQDRAVFGLEPLPDISKDHAPERGEVVRGEVISPPAGTI